MTVVLCLVCPILFACNNSGKETAELECSFIDIKWTREGEGDTEFISFRSDGSCSYYCTCGNPVNDFDLCDSYTYDSDTCTIKLNYAEKTKDSIPKIKVLKCNGEELVLDFGKYTRTFQTMECGTGEARSLTKIPRVGPSTWLLCPKICKHR